MTFDTQIATPSTMCPSPKFLERCVVPSPIRQPGKFHPFSPLRTIALCAIVASSTAISLLARLPSESMCRICKRWSSE